MKTFKIPVISGKDSLSSTYRSSDGPVIKIPPVLCISVFGKIPDASKTVTADFKKTGSTIILVGKTDDGLCPKVDLKLLPKTFDAIHTGIRNGKILACHDVSEGGVVTSIFEMCVGGNCGVILDTSEVGFDSSEVELLFNETAGCFIVEVENETIAKQLFKNIPYKILGKTQEKSVIDVKGLFNVKVDELKKVWQEPMRRLFS